jgi:nucleoside-diphosphate-sugar epimerase
VAPVAAITGGTGFVGRSVARRLAASGWRIRLLARSHPAHEQLRDIAFETIIGALADRSSLERLVRSADIVVHCAGLIRAGSADAFHATNIEGSRNLGEAVSHAAPAARIIAVSSLAAREPGLSPYAQSKRAGERAILDAAPPARCLIVRPTAVFGPWDRDTLHIFRLIERGLAPVLNGPAARLSLIHVDDLADAIAALARKPPPDSLYELDDGKDGGYSWLDILSSAAAALGKKPIYVRVPPSLLRGAAATAQTLAYITGKTTPFTVAKAGELLHSDWTCQVSRRPPGDLWRPRIGIADGFSTTAAWYRSAGWL